MKPGVTTSEFWLTALGHIVALIALLHPGFKDPGLAQTLAPVAALVSGAVYSLGRAHVKASVKA